MRWPECQFIASERFGFLYMPIEKVACSSIKHWIIKLTTGEDVEKIHVYGQSHLELQTLPKDQAERLLRDPKLFRFAFVRNPWDRLVSAFTNKFASNRRPAAKFYTALTRRHRWNTVLSWASWLTAGLIAAPEKSDLDMNSSEPLAERLTFRQFVRELKYMPMDEFDTHWKPQYLSLGDQKLDFLGRFETLNDDFDYVCRHLKIKQGLPHKNQTPRDQEKHECLADWPIARLAKLPRFPEYEHFYTDDLIQEVADVYHEDVRRFGYDFASTPAKRRAA